MLLIRYANLKSNLNPYKNHFFVILLFFVFANLYCSLTFSATLSEKSCVELFSTNNVIKVNFKKISKSHLESSEDNTENKVEKSLDVFLFHSAKKGTPQFNQEIQIHSDLETHTINLEALRSVFKTKFDNLSQNDIWIYTHLWKSAKSFAKSLEKMNGPVSRSALLIIQAELNKTAVELQKSKFKSHVEEKNWTFFPDTKKGQKIKMRLDFETHSMAIALKSRIENLDSDSKELIKNFEYFMDDKGRVSPPKLGLEYRSVQQVRQKFLQDLMTCFTDLNYFIELNRHLEDQQDIDTKIIHDLYVKTNEFLKSYELRFSLHKANENIIPNTRELAHQLLPLKTRLEANLKRYFVGSKKILYSVHTPKELDIESFHSELNYFEYVVRHHTKDYVYAANLIRQLYSETHFIVDQKDFQALHWDLISSLKNRIRFLKKLMMLRESQPNFDRESIDFNHQNIQEIQITLDKLSDILNTKIKFE